MTENRGIKLEEINENEIIVENIGGEFQAYYKGQFAAGISREDAINKVKKFYYDELRLKNEKNKSENKNTLTNKKVLAHNNSGAFTWTGVLAYLSLFGLIANIIILISTSTRFLISLLLIFWNILIILVLFEIKSVVENHE